MDASFAANDVGYSSPQPEGLTSRRSPLHEIELIPRDIARFESLLAPALGSTLSDTFERASQQMDGRTLWHVNSTSQGGGVAEILQSVLSPRICASSESQ